MSCDCEMEARNAEQAKVLKILLAINFTMFVVEIVFGLLAQSTGLIADSLDMLADAAVYGLGLYVVGDAIARKAKAAFVSGILECLLGAGVLVEVGHHLLAGSEPRSALMMVIGGAALVANLACLALLSKHREGEVHMRASWIFSANDVLANLGVIVAGALVAWSGSALPDLVIGCAIAIVVMRGGLRIISEAKRELLGSTRQGPPMPS